MLSGSLKRIVTLKHALDDAKGESLECGRPCRPLVLRVWRKDDETWVRIGRGRCLEIVEGTRFIIYGEGVYKGDVVIRNVEDHASSGVLIQSGKRPPVVGDKATTRLDEPGN